jgi:hypothetical protein
MRTSLPSKIVVGALVGVVVVSLAMSGRLLLVEYARLVIVGMTLAVVYASMVRTYDASYSGLCLMAAALMYVVLACDPALNGLALFGKAAPALNGYRVVTLALLAVGVLVLLVPLVQGEDAATQWRALFGAADVYALTLLAIGWFAWTGLEVMLALSRRGDVVEGVLRGSKCVDLAAVYVLVVCGLRQDQPQRPVLVRTVLFSILALCAMTTIVGAARATNVFYTARIAEHVDTLTGAKRESELRKLRDGLQRVFGLDAREAMLVYEAGYADGARRYRAYHELVQQMARTTRDGLREAALGQELQAGNYRRAIWTLEAMPARVELSAFTQERSRDIAACLQSAMGSPLAHYLAGLLAWRNHDTNTAVVSLGFFLTQVSNHLNALYVQHACAPQTYPAPRQGSMPATGWLESQSTGKAFVEQADYVTLVYNQRVTGHLWVPTGTYDVVLWARDDGTLFGDAQASRFDPSCKGTLTIDATRHAVQVCTTNRVFLPYRFRVPVTAQPALFALEFTNDIFDGARGWDRNLSVARIDVTRVDAP